MGLSFVFLLGVVGTVRWALVFDYRAELEVGRLAPWLLFCLRGMQFDARVVGTFLLPFFVLLLLLAPRAPAFRGLLKIFHTAVRLFLFITLLLGLLDVLYVREYHERFNFWLFNFFFDDRGAVLKTIFTSYPLGRYLLCIVLLFWLLCRIYGRLTRLADALGGRPSAWASRLLTPLTLILLIAAARGSWVGRPLQQIDVAITGNALLNRHLPNSYYALYFAHKEYRLQHSASHILHRLSEERKNRALATLGLNPNSSLDSLIRHEARGPVLEPRPRHIFLIVMESLDSWPLLRQYEALGLYPHLRELARQGAHNPRFLPSGEGTAMAIMTQICNFPPMGFWPNYRPEGHRCSDFSVGHLFQRLGYRPRLFYGGYLSWQRLEDYARAHGFLEIFGGDVMEFYRGNEWGIDDEGLFRFVSRHLAPDEPSFNLILTTSNHPPFNVDLGRARVPLDDLRRFTVDEKLVRQLGHARYADRCVGRFVQEMAGRFPDALFVITGDHFSRRHLRKNFSLYEGHSVPLILYGRLANASLRARPLSPGSHIDLVRTMLELLAPEGFSYRSFGKNLFEPQNIPEAYGLSTALTDTHILQLPSGKVEELPQDDFPLGPVFPSAPHHSESQAIQTEAPQGPVAPQAIAERSEAWRTLAQWEFFHPDSEQNPNPE
jgi:phosphoglycerol transferase MdoB-like AlkP superfamily enzyme